MSQATEVSAVLSVAKAEALAETLLAECQRIRAGDQEAAQVELLGAVISDDGRDDLMLYIGESGSGT